MPRPYVPSDGEKLKTFRQRHNIRTQKHLADIAGISQGFVSQLESGKVEIPEYVRERLRTWLSGRRARRAAGDNESAGGYGPRTGSGLRARIKELTDAGLPLGAIARGCHVSLASLKVYMYSSQLPKKFTKNFQAYWSKHV